jgi:hypothetical protein
MSPEFPTTHWSLIDKARGSDAFLRADALDALVRAYAPALRAHLVYRRRLAADQADDVLQGFMADRVLHQRFLASADPTKGRFRWFLLRCLENYWLSSIKPGLPPIQDDDARARADADPFDVVWAQQTLSQALRRMRRECYEHDRQRFWTLFEQRLLQPMLLGTVPPDYERLAVELNFDSAQQAHNALANAKRHFRRVLEDIIAQYVTSEEDVQQEIFDLFKVLSTKPLDQSWLPSAITAAVSVNDADSEQAIDGTSPADLAKLLKSTHEPTEWDGFDLAATLERLLSLPITEALPELTLPDECVCPRAPPTLRELFTTTTPDESLLRAVKDWARQCSSAEAPPIPSEIASVLYYASIASAYRRLDRWISGLDPALFLEGARRLLSKEWVTDPFRSILESAGASTRNSVGL